MLMLFFCSAKREGRLKPHGLDPGLDARLEMPQGHAGDRYRAIASRVCTEAIRGSYALTVFLMINMFHLLEVGAGLGFITGG